MTRIALVVDDSRVARAYLARILANLGYRVCEAGDGDEALELLAVMPEPDVVFVDRYMPHMDGLELIRALRSELGLSNAAIVMVTCDNKPETIRAALSEGADEYIMKPFTEEVVASKLAYVGEKRG